MLNVGIIGAGGIAHRLHLPQLVAMPDADRFVEAVERSRRAIASSCACRTSRPPYTPRAG